MTVFKDLIGKRINGVFLARDNWTVVFRTTEGKYFRYDTANDCCNTVWVNHITGLDILGKGDSFDLMRGALVLGGEDKEWTADREWTEADGGDYGDVIQDGFYTLHTDRGYIDIEVRNDHNGYYGGDFEYNEDSDLDKLEDFRQVTEDF
jgi:hypothetical protein